MRTIAIISFLLLGTVSSAQDLKDFKWLAGKWKRENVSPGKTAYEVWDWNKKTGLKGKGVSLKGTDTTFVEYLKIIEQDEKLYYVAEVSHNAEPTYFEITSVTEKGFVSENPTHDFPKKIEYVLEDNRLTVTISGDGKMIPFSFVRED